MKKSLFLIVFLFSLFSFISCSKDEDVPQIKESMSAIVDGRPFQADTFVIATDATSSAQTTAINGTLGTATSLESIGLSVEDIKIGVFLLTNNSSHFAVYKGVNDEFISTEGKIEITKITEEWIEGSFAFKGQSINDPQVQVSISSGAFKVKNK